MGLLLFVTKHVDLILKLLMAIIVTLGALTIYFPAISFKYSQEGGAGVGFVNQFYSTEVNVYGICTTLQSTGNATCDYFGEDPLVYESFFVLIVATTLQQFIMFDSVALGLIFSFICFILLFFRIKRGSAIKTYFWLIGTLSYIIHTITSWVFYQQFIKDNQTSLTQTDNVGLIINISNSFVSAMTYLFFLILNIKANKTLREKVLAAKAAKKEML